MQSVFIWNGYAFFSVVPSISPKPKSFHWNRPKASKLPHILFISTVFSHFVSFASFSFSFFLFVCFVLVSNYDMTKFWINHANDVVVVVVVCFALIHYLPQWILTGWVFRKLLPNKSAWGKNERTRLWKVLKQYTHSALECQRSSNVLNFKILVNLNQKDVLRKNKKKSVKFRPKFCFDMTDEFE